MISASSSARLSFVLILSAVPLIAVAQGVSCRQAVCAVGSVVRTYAALTDGYFACPTRQLSEYTQTVLGLRSMHLQVTGQAPKNDPQTGEPVYEGEVKAMLVAQRQEAGVRSFQEAVKQCRAGANGLAVRVVENPSESRAMRVSDPSGNQFWLSKTHADRQ